MTTFQSIVYAIIHGMSEFLPISSQAHQILVPYLVGWPPPPSVLQGGLTLGSCLALFVFFRHDWASMISCFLQVVIYRKRPMTLDERLPIFLGITSLPVALIFYYFQEQVSLIEWSPLLVSVTFAVAGIPLWIFDYLSRKIKGTFDWNWFDVAWVGLFQATAIFPSCDPLSGALMGSLFLNYKREPALKYAYFACMPILLAHSLNSLKEINFHASAPTADMSWLSFIVASMVTFFVSLLIIGGFMKQVKQKGFSQYVIYRWVLAAGVGAAYWFRNRG